MIEIPHYKIDKELGTGGMSTVYLATHEILDRQVALKIMSPSFLKDGTFKECFINEGRIISKLNHPHIIHIYDIGISNDACYMAIELLEAETLRQKIDTGVFSAQEKQKIITQIASALNVAHEQNFIHRDIKPGNILFRENGDAVLTDFGISKVQDTEGEYTTLGFAAGTPSYMPPEFSMGEELDHRADIYSLGVVFYEMLTGEKPYKAKTTAAISYAHVNAPIPQLEPSLAHYQKVIDRALAKKPQDRFDSVIDFSNAIEMANASTSPTIIAKRADTFTQVTQAIEKPQVLQSSPETESGLPDLAETPLKSEAAQKPPWGLIGGGVAALSIALGVGSYFMLSSSKKVVTIKNVIDKKAVLTPRPQGKPSSNILMPEPSPVVGASTQQVIPVAIKVPVPLKPPTTKPPFLTQIEPIVEPEPEKPKVAIIKIDKKPKPNILTDEQVIIVNSLLDNCLLRASTTIKEQIRITKNRSIIKDIKKLKMNSGRTKFITDTRRQIQTSQQRIDNNISVYYKNLTKLKAYKVELVREQLTLVENDQSTKQVTRGVIKILIKHLAQLSKKALTLKVCKKDLSKYARNIASTF